MVLSSVARHGLNFHEHIIHLTSEPDSSHMISEFTTGTLSPSFILSSFGHSHGTINEIAI